MQGQKNSIDSFREAIEISEEAYLSRDPMSNQPSSVPPVEQRWPSLRGESSGSSIGNNNVRDESMTEDALFPSRAILSLGGNQSQGTSSNHAHQNVNLNEGYIGNSDNTEPSLFLSSRPERELTDSWGLSCKRKAVEGSSGQSCAGGSSSSSQPENRAWNTGATRGLRLSSPPINNTPLEPPNPRTRIPSPSIPDNTLNPRRFSLRRDPLGDPLEAPEMLNRALLGNNSPFPWNGASSSRAGNVPFGGEAREEPSSRRIPRTHVDPWVPHHGSLGQHRQRAVDFSPWSLFPGEDSPPIARSVQTEPVFPGASSSRDGSMSLGRSNQSRQQPYLRSALAERQGDDSLSISNSLRVLSADVEGRRRLISEIRQVLHAMRRGDNLQMEDYMLLDPFVFHGMAEMHDRHRDMRLDVDNMSYEELLALGERIGDVSTGLNEGTIFELMKRRRYQLVEVEPGVNPEPCCICQEEYAEGDDVGTLDCGHDFHPFCIKKWLTKKNTCPICKTTGLKT